MIPYGHQEISQADIDAVVAVLKSDFLTQGPMVPRFEQAVAMRCGAKRAVAANSATSALHVACLALELGPGDTLWTVPNTFVASANCGRYCGADIDFVDIDPYTWNMSVPALRTKLIEARRGGKLPKVVVPVHFAGQPTEQEAIWELAREFGFKVLEDASHAIGASRRGERVGNCKWSHITVFSFHPVKIITTGEGGMALSNDSGLADRMAMLLSHGITRNPARFRNSSDDSADPTTLAHLSAHAPRRDFAQWYYEQQILGFNYRMTDIQAALGVSQLERLEDYIRIRNDLARRYDRALQHLPLQLPTVQSENRSAFHLYVVRLKRAATAKTQRQVIDELRSRGIGANVHYIPVHLQPYYRELGFAPRQFPQAEAHAREAITLPLYSTMTVQQQDQVVNALNQVLADA